MNAKRTNLVINVAILTVFVLVALKAAGGISPKSILYIGLACVVLLVVFYLGNKRMDDPKASPLERSVIGIFADFYWLRRLTEREKDLQKHPEKNSVAGLVDWANNIDAPAETITEDEAKK